METHGNLLIQNFASSFNCWFNSDLIDVSDHAEAISLARIIHEKCAIKAKSLTSFATMRTGCLMEFFAMKSLAQAFGGLGRFRAI